MAIVVNTKEEQNKFILDEGEKDQKPAYILYRKIYTDKFLEIQERHGEYQFLDNDDDKKFSKKERKKKYGFRPKTMVGAKKEVRMYCAQDWEGVEDENGNKLPLNADNLMKALIQTDKLDEFDKKILPKSLQEDEDEDELKN